MAMSSAFATVESGDISKLQSLLKDHQQLVHERNKDGRTLLMVAAVQGHKEIAELLLKQNGVPLNETDKDGQTAVFLAARHGNFEVVKLLTAKFPSLKEKNRNGDSILMGPARSGFSIIVEHLLDCNADPNMQDEGGWTPLMVAASRGQKDVVETLLENNASVSLKGYEDCTTALKEAVKGRHVEVIQMLANAEIKLDKRNDRLYKCKTTDEARELIKENVTVEQVKGDGKTPLMAHAERDNTDICKLLLENGAQIDRQDRRGQTALMKASYRGKLPTVQLLISKRCIPDLKTTDSWTALMFAAEHGHTNVVKALVLAGANMTIRNGDGNLTALEIAKDKGHDKIVQFLIDRSKAIDEHQRQISMTPFVTKLNNYISDKKNPSASGGPQIQEQTVAKVDTKEAPNRSYLSTAVASNRSSLSTAVASNRSSLSVTTSASDLDEESSVKKELKNAQEKVANLETRVQELTLRTTLEPNDEDLSHLPPERMKEELLKARELKKKMEKYATDAKQSAQRLSAENHKLREQVSKEKHAHELHWKNALREVEQKIDQATATEQLSKHSLEFGARMSHAASVRARNITELPKCTITPQEVKNLLFEDKQHTSLKMDMFLLVLCGLPTSGKSTLLSNFDMDHDLLQKSSHTQSTSLGVEIHELGYLKKSLDPIPLWVTSTGKDIVIFMMALAIIKKCAHEKKSPSFSLDVNTSDMFHDVTFECDLFRDNLRFILERIKYLVPELVKRTNKHLSVETLVTSRLSIFNCWDVGVCRAMYTILPLLANVSKRLFLINFLDLSRDGSELFEEPKLDGYGDNDYLMQLRSKLHYLLRIAGLTRETANSVAEVLRTTIVVANVREDAKTDRQTLKALLRDVSTAIFQKADDVGIGQVLYPDILAIDVSSKEHAESMQRVIEHVIKLAKCLEVDMPLNWMFFRTALYDHDTFYITKSELSAMAAECHIHKEEELLRFLSLFTHIGSLLYFPDVFGEYIVLRPQGFFEAIHKMYYPEKSIGEGHKQVLQNGYLCNVVAEQLWSKEAQLFMVLLCESGLACDLSELPSSQAKYCDVCPFEKVKRCLYVPSLRIDTGSQSGSKRSTADERPDVQDRDTSKSLFVTFNTEYIPTSLQTTLVKYLGSALMEAPDEEDKKKQPQFLIEFNIEESGYSLTMLRLTPPPESKFHSHVQAVVINIITHGDVLEINFQFEPVREAKHNKPVSKDDLENYFYSLLKDLIVKVLSKVLVYFKDVRYRLAFPCCSVPDEDQAKRLGHYIYFHPHDSRREELFCYYKRDPDLKPHDDSPQEKGRRVNQCMRLQKLTREQQKWTEAMCTFTDSSSLFGMDENDKLEPTELRDLAERITNSSFDVLTHGHSQNSFSLDPTKHIRLCEMLLEPHIPRHTYILEKIKVLHQSKTPADLVTAALTEWQNISPAHTKQRLAEVLYESGYYLESLRLDARLINKSPIFVQLSHRELTLVSVHAAAEWKELAKQLQLTQADIKAIKQCTPKSNRRKMDCCLQCLETWRQRFKMEELTILREILIKCLKKIGHHTLADLLVTGSDSYFCL